MIMLPLGRGFQAKRRQALPCLGCSPSSLCLLVSLDSLDTSEQPIFYRKASLTPLNSKAFPLLIISQLSCLQLALCMYLFECWLSHRIVISLRAVTCLLPLSVSLALSALPGTQQALDKRLLIIIHFVFVHFSPGLPSFLRDLCRNYVLLSHLPPYPGPPSNQLSSFVDSICSVVSLSIDAFLSVHTTTTLVQVLMT